MRHLAKVSTLSESVLWEPASRGWLEKSLLCPEVDDWQGTTDLMALVPSFERTSIPLLYNC